MDKETEVWFAMRATYRRELEAMHLLEKANIGCFIPMQYKISIRRGRKVRALVPVIRNLVFVHARPSEVQRFKYQITYLQYITDTRSGQKIVIPERRCWDTLDTLPSSLLKLRLLTACYGEVFDEPLADEGRSIIASWNSASLTAEQQEAVNEFWNVVDNPYPWEYIDE